MTALRSRTTGCAAGRLPASMLLTLGLILGASGGELTGQPVKPARALTEVAAVDGGHCPTAQGQAAICRREAGDGARHGLMYTRHSIQEQTLTTLSQGGWVGEGFFVLAAR